MIKPTVGRVVLFTPSVNDPTRQLAPGPQAAIVCYVHWDRMVNLAVFDANGRTYPASSVTLVQEGDEKPAQGYFAEWMPYQKAVAKGEIPPTLHKS